MDILDDVANEKTTSVYSCSLLDLDDALVPGTALTALYLTLRDMLTGRVINSRFRQNALNANNVTVSASGLLEFILQPADNIIINPALDVEVHVATFEAVWSTGRVTDDVGVPVRNLRSILGRS